MPHESEKALKNSEKRKENLTRGRFSLFLLCQNVNFYDTIKFKKKKERNMKDLSFQR